jgi:type I phosphodiesterase/nucleotide pyrophosphatase
MKANRLRVAGFVVALVMLSTASRISAQPNGLGTKKVKHVLLLSVDGMHAVDFYNCAHGIDGVNSGNPYCPNLAALARTGINYVAAISSKPSDSFPGMAALVTGGTPKSTGLYYDVAYDRSLDPPKNTTGTGLAGGSCTPFALPTGTTTDYDQGVDFDDTMLNGGAPGASPTDGGVASIDPTKLVRDPAKNCAPVYPWNFVRVNTIYGVIHKAGGYTAWIDKHASYSFVGGPGGKNLDDYFAPEVDSNVIPLPGVTTSLGVACAPIPDQSSSLGSWTASFQNIQCYDALKVNALLNEIAGKTHAGAPAVIPAIFGMNFQSVYIGESVNSATAGAGGYQNAAALPTTPLLNAIEFVDASVGDIVSALKHAGIYDDTLIIITAKHGESPIDPSLYVGNGNSPATLLGNAIPASESPLTSGGIGSTEDDVSVLWLAPGQSVTAAVALLEKNAATIQLGQLFYGPTLALNYNAAGLDPGQDPRSPDIVVTPNIGVTYLGTSASVGDHGGFGHDDTNVVLLVSHQSFSPATVSNATTTTQVAPTILKALGLDPTSLEAVKKEGTSVLPEVASQLE